MVDEEKPVEKEGSKPGGSSKARIIGARVLTVLAILLALVGMLGFYVEHTALDEDGFETISRNMIENDEIRTQVASQGGRRRCSRTSTSRRRSRSDCPRHRQGWRRCWPGSPARAPIGRQRRRSNGRACRRCGWRRRPRRSASSCSLLDDETTFIQTEGGAVVLDLRPIVIDLGDQVAVIGKVAERLPGVRREDRDHRGEPARDGADDHEDPARGRRLDVARRARRRGARGLAGARAAPARDPRARARRAPRRAADAGRAPLRRRLPRRRARQGRSRRAGAYETHGTS